MNKLSAAVLTVCASIFLFASAASATVSTEAVDTATSVAGDLKDTFLAVVAVLIPIAVTILLVKKALPMAKRWLHI